MTPKPHERLAAAIEDRRSELGLSLREVAELAGITGETLRAVRKGSNNPSQLTRRGIERALEWTPGSVDAVLRGGEPGIAVSGSAASGGGEDDDPKMQRAMELLAEATAMLEEIRRERRDSA